MPLTANTTRKYYVDQTLRTFPVLNAVNIFKGGLIGLELATKYARPYVAGDYFVGIAEEAIDNTTGAAGAKSVQVRTQGDIELPLSGVAVGDIGKQVIATSDSAIAVGTTVNRIVGRIIGVADTNVAIVRLKPFLNEATI